MNGFIFSKISINSIRIRCVFDKIKDSFRVGFDF